MKRNSSNQFPRDFIWGTATSAFQIEGGVLEEGRKESNWDVFCKQPGRILNNDTGDFAANHYYLWKEDIALMAKLGIRSYRFSISWSRIIPEGTGKANEKGLAFYDRLIDELLVHGIIPMITLFHWDLPEVLQREGGWLTRSTVKAFVDYAKVVFKRYSDRVKYWITHNEPWVVATLGYRLGLHAPGICDPNGSMKVAHHMLLSHGIAIQEMRAHSNSNHKFGIALNLNPTYAYRSSKPGDIKSKQLYNSLLNNFYLDGLFHGLYPQELLNAYPSLGLACLQDDMQHISIPIDFLGINYYTRSVIREKKGVKEGVIVPAKQNLYSSMWEFFPEGLSETINMVWTQYKPKEIFITENGTALNDVVTPDGEIHDVFRIEYINSHLKIILNLLSGSVPISGYYVWSFLDNFEWTYGYDKRFGLVHVDFKTFKRTIKQSGYWYGRVAQRNALSA